MSWQSCIVAQPKHAGHYLVECGVTGLQFRAFWNPKQQQWMNSKDLRPIAFGMRGLLKDRWKEHSQMRVNAKGPNSLHPM